MANEITVNTTLQVTKRDSNGVELVRFQSQPSVYRDDMTGSSGPYGGVKNIQQTYTIIDLSQAGTAKWTYFQNQSDTYTVEIGIWYPATNDFLPFIELPPGAPISIPLSPYISQTLVPGTGTGTSDTNTVYLAAKSNGGVSSLLVQSFPV